MIEQLYWKTVWNRVVHTVDSCIHHQQPSVTEQAAFEKRLVKLAHAQVRDLSTPTAGTVKTVSETIG